MTRKQILKLLEVNPEAVIRQKNWFPYEGLKFDQSTELFVDELGYEFKNLELFGSSEWEVMSDSQSQVVM